jgi:hypothetical protein
MIMPMLRRNDNVHPMLRDWGQTGISRFGSDLSGEYLMSQRPAKSSDIEMSIKKRAGKALYEYYYERHPLAGSVQWKNLPQEERVFWRVAAMKGYMAIARKVGEKS